MSQPLRGEVWLATLDPTIGREQAGTRPALIVSDDLFNQSHAELVVVLPITSKNKGIRSHVPFRHPKAGWRFQVTSSAKMCVPFPPNDLDGGLAK